MLSHSFPLKRLCDSTKLSDSLLRAARCRKLRHLKRHKDVTTISESASLLELARGAKRRRARARRRRDAVLLTLSMPPRGVKDGLEETFAVLRKAALLCEDGALHEVVVTNYKYPFSERSFDVLVARDSGLGRKVCCWALEGVCPLVVASHSHPVLGSLSARHCTGRKNQVYI